MNQLTTSSTEEIYENDFSTHLEIPLESIHTIRKNTWNPDFGPSPNQKFFEKPTSIKRVYSNLKPQLTEENFQTWNQEFCFFSYVINRKQYIFYYGE